MPNQYQRWDDLVVSYLIDGKRHEHKLEVYDIVCPHMVFGGVQVKRPTMSYNICRGRIRYSAGCIRTCPIAAKMKREIYGIDTPTEERKKRKKALL